MAELGSTNVYGNLVVTGTANLPYIKGGSVYIGTPTEASRLYFYDGNGYTLSFGASTTPSARNWVIAGGGSSADHTLTLANSGTGFFNILLHGNLVINTAGKGLQIKEGSNARMGVATLVAGTVTVSNTSVTANSRIFLTVQSLGTVTVPSAVGISARVAGTSFTIKSSASNDTSVVAWHIIEPA